MPKFRVFFTTLTSGTPVPGTDVIYETAYLAVGSNSNGVMLTHMDANNVNLYISHRLFFTSISTFTTATLSNYSAAESGQVMLVAF